jgi:hypothetical protein
MTRAGGRPHRFLHNNFSSVYQIFTKLGHMIPLWKGKNPIYFDGKVSSRTIEFPDGSKKTLGIMMVGDFFNFKFKTRIFWHCK